MGAEVRARISTSEVVALHRVRMRHCTMVCLQKRASVIAPVAGVPLYVI